VNTRIDHLTGGIYRIATFFEPYGITFNQFLIDDERPMLIHTGMDDMYEAVRQAVAEVLDPAQLAYVALLHWEGDEAGGLDRWIAQAPQAEVVGSDLSIALNLNGFGVPHRALGMRDGDTLDLGRHQLRFLETPHVHHWDSMMVVETTTNSLFPADLFLQPGDQPPVVTENLGDAMNEQYRFAGIFAHEQPVREVVDRLEPLDLDWVHAMHGGSLTREALPYYVRALREQDFAWRGMLLGRELGTARTAGG
jgi:flavorubredoxin